jgi:hypothetical protein
MSKAQGQLYLLTLWAASVPNQKMENCLASQTALARAMETGLILGEYIQCMWTDYL